MAEQTLRFNDGSGLTPDGTVVRDATITPAPSGSSSTAIAMDQLEATQPINLPTPDMDTSGADGIVAGAEQATKTFSDYLKEQTPEATEASKSYDKIFGDITTLLPELANKKGDQLKAEQDAKLPQTKNQLAEINSLITTRLAQYNKQISEQELAPGEVPRPIVLGKQAAIRRNQAADIGLLQARALGLQGQIQAAQDSVDRAIDLKYGAMEDTINVKMRQLDLIQPILDKEERRHAEALSRKYEDERIKLAEEKEKAKFNLNLAIQQGVNSKFANIAGEIINTATGKGWSDEESFLKATGMTVDQAYAQGLVTDINYQKIEEHGAVMNMINQFPDAKIFPSDSLAVAREKLQGSRTYQEQFYHSGGGGGSAGILGLTNQQIDNISPLVTQFQNSPIVQNYNTIGEGYHFVKSLDNNTTNPADDQALIYALAKALDPGSVVREGEYATVQKYAQSMAQSYGKSVSQAISGTGFLSQDARKNIKATIESRFKSAENSYKNLYGETERRVNLIGNTDKGSLLLNNYGGAFAGPSSGSLGESGSIPPGETGDGSLLGQASGKDASGFFSKIGNWLWGE